MLDRKFVKYEAVQPSAPAPPSVNEYSDLQQQLNHAHKFRLYKINEVQKERDKRASLAKKYQRDVNVPWFQLFNRIGLCWTVCSWDRTILKAVISTLNVIIIEGTALTKSGLYVARNVVCGKELSYYCIHICS